MDTRTTILVVDADAGTRRLLACALRRHLADLVPEILPAAGAAAALRQLRAGRPALVRRLKADSTTAALPVVALGVTALEHAAPRRAGADAALTRPLRTADLAAAVRALLDSR